MATAHKTTDYNTFCERSSFSVQKVIFYALKGGLLRANMPPFAKPLIFRHFPNGRNSRCRYVHIR